MTTETICLVQPRIVSVSLRGPPTNAGNELKTSLLICEVAVANVEAFTSKRRCLFFMFPMDPD